MKNNDIDLIIKLCYLDSSIIKNYRFEFLYSKYYNMTIYSKNRVQFIRDFFDSIYKNLLNNKLIIKNIKSVNDVLLYPINLYNIDFINKCEQINNTIIKERYSIIKCLNKYLNKDFIYFFYYKYLALNNCPHS